MSSPGGQSLLGQSFLQRFRSWSIDNPRNELVLERDAPARPTQTVEAPQQRPGPVALPPSAPPAARDYWAVVASAAPPPARAVCNYLKHGNVDCVSTWK